MLRAVWVVLLAIATAACSVATVSRTPSRPWGQRPQCTSGRTTVRNDLLGALGVVGTGMALVLIGAAADDEDPDHLGEKMNGTMFFGAVMMVFGSVTFGGSAGYGLNQTNRCRAAQAAYDRGERY